ncbi:hypothetical protein Skr01_02180 [Sphaerisporangium krabiense]|uniref:Terpene synthase n=1 Tax=Sphaerisporangium krabiense TaxID=763782 RepID=A0A7W8Z7X2_9ACTN|nr:terpene synthase family protein [Sphaerisporangium krabiense]MBB5629027.1 hypothetical protein [Sphaerisporangium krabiense]GII60133.1 hypothetical protein Skr01_02180 [Sphaerisporangium krabiense]
MSTDLDALEIGRICAEAGRSQRHMRQWTAEYPGLFPARPFDAAFYGTLSMAMAFSGPWFTAEELKITNKAALWGFAADWLADYVHSSPGEVRELVGACLAVADGVPPAAGDDLGRTLAHLRADLAAAPAFPELETVWRDELARMLDTMARESDWKAAGITPSLEEYLDNADNHGFCFVFACHWIATGGPDAARDADRVRQAARAVQRVMRLLNDLSSYERDKSWGDLNALLIGVSREQVLERAAALTREARTLIGELRGGHDRLAVYMERQMDFCAGFYEVGAYWGSL